MAKKKNNSGQKKNLKKKATGKIASQKKTAPGKAVKSKTAEKKPAAKSKKAENKPVIENPAEAVKPVETAGEDKEVKESSVEESSKTNAKKKGSRKKIVIASLALVSALLAFYFYVPKFQDFTVEAGTEEEVTLGDFLRSPLYRYFSKFEKKVPWHFTDKVGETDVVLSFLGRKETVRIYVVDTTPPDVVFQDVRQYLDYELKPDDFVESYKDVSEVIIEYAGEEPDTSYYQYSKVNIIVKDIYDNKTEGSVNLLISWLKSEATIELGSTEVASQLVFDPSKAGEIPAEQLAKINPKELGDYYISFTAGDMPLDCHVSVVDTTPPVVKLKSISVYDDDTRRFSYNDFITSISDNSGHYTVSMSTIDYTHLGDQTVIITAVDPSGNKTEAKTIYNRHKDTTPPSISGLGSITINKHSSYDWLKGVSAYDEKDGAVKVTITSNGVNVDKYGTYYITYSAKDKAGNVATGRRKVTVLHDSEDTRALVSQMASQCGNSISEIRSYVISHIKYSNSWGGDDPLWYGLTNYRGNCYVHAQVYKALLEAKGYSTMIIHTTDRVHYWNLVYSGGRWWHSDSTPSARHGRMPVLGTDEERLSTLHSGGDWDRNAYPACP